MKKILSVILNSIYLVFKPYLDILILPLLLSSYLGHKKLSNVLFLNKKKNSLHMNFGPIQALKIWFCFSPFNENKLINYLSEEFLLGLEKLEKNKVYKTNVNKLFLSKLVKMAKKKSIKLTHKEIEITIQRQILARLLIIGPIPYFVIFVGWLLGIKKCKKVMERVTKKTPVVELEIYIN